MTLGGSYGKLLWEDIEAGDRIPEVSLEMTYRKVVHSAAAAGWDWFPGHHDPEYARAQGQQNIYTNTTTFQGFVDRVITSWAGPWTFIARRKIRMLQSIFAGDTMFGSGHVDRSYRDEQGRNAVDVEITIRNQDGVVCCSAEATIILPMHD